MGRLHKNRIFQVALHGRGVQRAAPLDQVLHHRQTALPAQPLGDLLVHGHRRAKHAGAHIGQVRKFEQSLHGAILAEGSVQDGKHDVDAGIGARLRQDGPRRPAPVLADKEPLHLVTRRLQGGDNRFGRKQRDLMLAAAAAVDHSYTQLHRIAFPRADIASSTASAAVRLPRSSTGFTSTTSMLRMPPLSQMSSMARCASR